MSDFQPYPVNAPAGANFSLEPSLLNPLLWDEADNVTFRHGKTFKCSGYEQGFGKAKCVPEVIVPLRADDNNYYWWTYAGDKMIKGAGGNYSPVKKIYKITSVGDHDDVTPDGGIDTETGFFVPVKWSGDTINSIPYMCYGKPYIWDHVKGKYNLSRKFPKHVNFRLMRTYRNYMIGLNFETKDYEGEVDEGFSAWNAGTHQNAVWWSHEVIAGNIQPSYDWPTSQEPNPGPRPGEVGFEKSMWCDSDPTRNSGWNFLGGSGGPILEGKELRDNFIIYRERSVWQMSWIGGINVFAFKELFDDVGALNGSCVVEIEGEHLVIGSSDIYMHNGVQKKSIVDGIVRKEIFSSIDPSHQDKVFIAVNYKHKEAWVCIPESSSNLEGTCNKAYVYNWIEQTWSRRDIPDLLCSSYTILDLPSTDISWDAPSEGGPVNPDTNEGFDLPGTTWEQSVDNWLDSYYKYNPSEWGLVFGSARVIPPDSEIGTWVDENDWIDEDFWYEREETDDYEYHIYTSIEEPLLDGLNFEAVIEKKWMDMGDRSDASFVNKVYPLVRGGLVDIYMAGTHTVDQGIEWRYLGRFDPLMMTKLSARISGQFVHIRFVIPENSRAEIRGYTLEFSKIGRRA